MKTARIDLRTPPATKTRWETAAQNTGQTLTQLITTAVEHHLSTTTHSMYTQNPVTTQMYTQTSKRKKPKPPTPPPAGPPRGLEETP